MYDFIKHHILLQKQEATELEGLPSWNVPYIRNYWNAVYIPSMTQSRHKRFLEARENETVQEYRKIWHLI